MIISLVNSPFISIEECSKKHVTFFIGCSHTVCLGDNNLVFNKLYSLKCSAIDDLLVPNFNFSRLRSVCKVVAITAKSYEVWNVILLRFLLAPKFASWLYVVDVVNSTQPTILTRSVSHPVPIHSFQVVFNVSLHLFSLTVFCDDLIYYRIPKCTLLLSLYRRKFRQSSRFELVR